MRGQKESYVKAKGQRVQGSKGCLRGAERWPGLGPALGRGNKEKMLNIKSTLG